MSYKDNIACVFGLKQLQTILEIKPEYSTNIKDNIFKGLSQSQETKECEESVTLEDIEIDLSEDSNDADSKDDSIASSQKSQGYKNGINPIEFTGFVSSCAHGSGRSSTDRQFYYVNSRPCEPTKVMKVINEIYRQYNPNQYPFVFLNINLDRTSVDVNVTPDKRKIFLTKETIVLEVLKQSLFKLFENIPRTLQVETSLYHKEADNIVKPELSQPRIFNAFLQRFEKHNSAGNQVIVERNYEKNLELKRKSTTMLDFISSKVKKTESDDLLIKEDNCIVTDDANELTINNSPSKDTYEDHRIQTTDYDESIKQEDIERDYLKKICTSGNSDNKDVLYLESTDKMPNTQIRNIDDVVIEKSHTISCRTKPHSSSKGNLIDVYKSPEKQPKVVTDKEDLGKNHRKIVTLKTSLEHVTECSKNYNKQNNKSAPDKIRFKSVINPVFNKKCEEELSKEISKDSFKNMTVVGQFNLGFIITKLDDDLFIIDQHATDEIYNFETLQKTTELTNQKLVMYVQLNFLLLYLHKF